MNQEAYSYNNILPRKYSFVSEGEKRIVKLVEFTRTGDENIVNLGFGDLLPDTDFDDQVVSNNGDIMKIFATIIEIVKEFTAEFPHLKIAFDGSTPERMKLYNRILKTYYSDFSKEFQISGLIEDALTELEADFEPKVTGKYILYFVKRKS